MPSAMAFQQTNSPPKNELISHQLLAILALLSAALTLIQDPARLKLCLCLNIAGSETPRPYFFLIISGHSAISCDSSLQPNLANKALSIPSALLRPNPPISFDLHRTSQLKRWILLTESESCQPYLLTSLSNSLCTLAGASGPSFGTSSCYL